ncbi:hypothetical protein [Chryseobacterium camelliae]|uniref:hypothetical protein n=1 Tax=Chryseobacterium camelliae TaxID=1265445 RepID=UPI00285FCC71|nr:hypothetical protein [Chryseobacterium camelliae]MDR6517323.1 hypothetical protein [Chryseobacterium camelliae]
MKVRGYKFGHPIFGYHDYFDFTPDFNINFDIDNNKLNISITDFNLGSNNTLAELLESGKVCLMAEVFCSYTMFRQCILLNHKRKFSVNLDLLKTKVECYFFIISNETIENYSNSSVIQEFSNDKFFIEYGDVLAFLGDYKFELDLKGTTVESFIKIREKLINSSGVEYIFTNNSIILEINKREYEKIKKYHLNPDFQQILISSLLQPALIHACYKLQNEEYEEKAWFRTLMLRWEKLKNTEEPPTADEIPQFVESLLSDPMNRLVDVLENIDEKSTIDDSY